MRNECIFKLGPWPDWYLPICGVRLQFCEYLSIPKRVNTVVHTRKWANVLYGSFSKLRVVNAESKLPIFLGCVQYLRCSFELGRFDNTSHELLGNFEVFVFSCLQVHPLRWIFKRSWTGDKVDSVLRDVNFPQLTEPHCLVLT